MKKTYVLALLGALLLAVAAPVCALAASSAGPKVSVRIATRSKTLRSVKVHGQTGWITKGGTPRGKCSGRSAAGALNAATRGKWDGTYYKSIGGIFVTSILGVKPKGSYYWSVYVDGKSSNYGICQIKLRKGERLLFKVVKG